MYLTDRERVRIDNLLERYVENPRVQEMKEYIQHGTITTYEHCMRVADMSFWMNRRLGLGANERVLVIGAFLHDLYLYDWHVPEEYHRLHGFTHADVARRNAVMLFDVGLEEQMVILSHMWPLNITRIPRSREAVIVCIADKICSAVETIVRGQH